MAVEQRSAFVGNYFLDCDIRRNPPHIVSQLQDIDLKQKVGEEAEIEISPELFAPTKNGQKYYSWIEAGSPCETTVEDTQGNIKCEKRSIVALEFDIPNSADPEVSLACSLEHMEQARIKLDESIRSYGKTTIFGINGWGRA